VTLCIAFQGAMSFSPTGKIGQFPAIIEKNGKSFGRLQALAYEEPRI